jgi:hypothetical protein
MFHRKKAYPMQMVLKRPRWASESHPPKIGSPYARNVKASVIADAMTGPFPKAPAVFCEPFGGALLYVSDDVSGSCWDMLTQLHFLRLVVFL